MRGVYRLHAHSQWAVQPVRRLIEASAPSIPQRMCRGSLSSLDQFSETDRRGIGPAWEGITRPQTGTVLKDFVHTALHSRSCSVADWEQIASMLKTMARQGPLLSSTTLVRLFRLLDVKVPRGNEESFASSPYRAVSAAAALHTQQASEVLSPPQIADCFNMLRMVSKSVSPSAVQSVLCNLTVALGRTMQTHSMWTPTKVSDMLFGLNQISSATYSKELMKLLPLVTKCVNNCGVFTSREVGRAFYGLKNMSIRAGEAYPALETLLGALTDQLAGTTELDSRELGMVLYSLNGMGSHSAAVRRVLACVASKLPGMKSTLDAQAIGNIMYGLKSLSTEHTEVLVLLKTLVMQMARCTQPLDGQELSNALFGFQNFNSSDKEVLELLGVILEHMQRSTSVLSAQGVGNSLYGLQGMSSSEPVVQRVIAELTRKIRADCEPMTSQQIGNSCYGLRSMRSDVPEVCSLLQVLAKIIRRSKLKPSDPVSAQCFANTMYGMRLLDSSVPEVRCLLIAVFKKIRDSSASLSPQEFSNYLFGFQSMRFISPEVLMLLKLLEDKIVKRRVDVAIKFKPQEVSMALVGLQYVAQALPSSLMFFEFISAAVKNRDRRFSAEEIAHCLHCLKSFEDSNLPARELVAALTNCLDETARAEELSPAQIAVALYGLRKMATGSPEVLSLISKLTACAASSSRAFEGKDVHNSLYGINSLSGDIAAVKELLFVVGSKIMIGPGYLKSREIAGALYGLRYTSSDNSAARLILDKLTNQLIINRSLDEPYISAGDISAMIYSLHEKQMEWDAVRSIIGVLTDEMLFSLRYQNVHFSTPELSMIFYGVKLISCYEYDEFNKLMHALASVLTAHVGLIDAQCVGNLFYGLHSMSSTHPECRQLLLAVSNKIERCSDDVALSGQAIGNALYGCQGMDCIHVEVRQLISALTKLMSSQKNKGRVKLTGQEIGNALYGLQHMSNTTDEVASLLAALVDCLPPTELSTCVDQMNFSDVGMALFGLHDMTVKNEVLDKLLQELLRRLNNICALTIGVDNSQLTMLSQNITLLLYLNNKATSWVEEHKEVLENANNAIVNKLKCNGSYMHYGSVASVIEGRIFLIFKEALIANRNVLSVTNNESLLCFEADIAIRFLTPDGNEALINIEIDGPYHKRSSLFTRLRDEFLYSKSEIHTLRLPVRGSFLSESYSINLSAAASNIKAATAAEQALDVIRGSDVSFTGSPVELLTSLLVQPISTLNNQYTVEVK